MNIFKRMEEVKVLIREMSAIGLHNERERNIAYDYTTMYGKLSLWVEHDSKTFRLSKELIDMFTLTDVPLSVRPSDFKFPFNIFLIEGEKPLYDVALFNGESANVHALLFVDSKVVQTNNKTILVNRDGERISRIDWDVSISGLSVGRDKGLVGDGKKKGFGIDHMWVNLRNNETIEDACLTAKKAHEAREVVTIPEAQRAINIFFNTIMYIMDPKRDRADTEAHGKSKYKVGPGKGQSVRSEYIVLRPPKQYRSYFGNKTGRTIDKRFWVRGHYRNQAKGKGYLEREYIFIAPHPKGPEFGTKSNKKYKVK